MRNSTVSLLLTILFFWGCATPRTSWKSPSYEKKEYRKVLVLAKTSDEMARRQLEDATVQQLRTKGISAIPAYANFNAEDTRSEAVFLKKARALQVDALLTYSFDNVKTEYKRGPSIDASVGVPVRLGIFRGFLGSSVPLAGGPRSVETIQGEALFYVKDATAPQWSLSLKGSLKNGTQKLAAAFAGSTVDKMDEDSLFQ